MKFIGYIQCCPSCVETFEDASGLMVSCPTCKEDFSPILTYKHFVLPFDLAYVVFNQCDVCKIRFDTDKEEDTCFQCKGPTINIGTCHTSFLSARLRIKSHKPENVFCLIFSILKLSFYKLFGKL